MSISNFINRSLNFSIRIIDTKVVYKETKNKIKTNFASNKTDCYQ